ncbi:50S ribosomal protein L9 [Candidatus Karelsulcia muelleri]|uniref:50S ribosomal protein L9 n=1 Tax=Candidatus Karelsulcia muelleri TaxID=336810 RepID=UPI000D7C2FE7|nr:50S ribosomal protein L9 [Candidatus Karelsulcia muelleri]
MKIILKKKILNLGKKNDLIEVKPGYARNFLFPKKKAILATISSIKELNNFIKKKKIKKKFLRKKLKFYLKYIKKLKIKFYLKLGENGKLFGSISKKKIYKYLKSKNIKINKKFLFIDPIKQIGVFPCKIILHPKVHSKFEFEVSYKKVLQ